MADPVSPRQSPVRTKPMRAKSTKFATLLFLSLPLAILTGCSQSAPRECKLILATDLPLRGAPGAWLVDASLNGAPAHLLFDTGSFSSVLTPKAVQRLGLYHESWMVGESTGIGGSQSLSIVAARDFQLGSLHGKNFRFFSSAMGPRNASWFEDGLLSTDFLSKYEVDLDFGEKRVGLYYPQGDCSGPHAALTPPMYTVPMTTTAKEAVPHVHVTIGGHDFVAIIDTGAPSTVMFRGAAARLGLRIGALPADRHHMAAGTGPRPVQSVEHVVEAIGIGDITVRNVPVTIVDQYSDDDVDMLLGADFQMRVHLWLSYPSHSLVMQYPPLPTPATSQ
jgi:predicted aspartyl protease